MNANLLDASLRHEAVSASDNLALDLETLADSLSLLVPDVERPPRWHAQDFVREVAVIRSTVTSILDGRRLAELLRHDGTGPAANRHERASARLASDATAVALAIRWLELENDLRLPSWPEILRRRTLFLTAGSPSGVDVSVWFG